MNTFIKPLAPTTRHASSLRAAAKLLRLPRARGRGGVIVVRDARAVIAAATIQALLQALIEHAPDFMPYIRARLCGATPKAAGDATLDRIRHPALRRVEVAEGFLRAYDARPDSAEETMKEEQRIANANAAMQAGYGLPYPKELPPTLIPLTSFGIPQFKAAAYKPGAVGTAAGVKLAGAALALVNPIIGAFAALVAGMLGQGKRDKGYPDWARVAQMGFRGFITDMYQQLQYDIDMVPPDGGFQGAGSELYRRNPWREVYARSRFQPDTCVEILRRIRLLWMMTGADLRSLEKRLLQRVPAFSYSLKLASPSLQARYPGPYVTPTMARDEEALAIVETDTQVGGFSIPSQPDDTKWKDRYAWAFFDHPGHITDWRTETRARQLMVGAAGNPNFRRLMLEALQAQGLAHACPPPPTLTCPPIPPAVTCPPCPTITERECPPAVPCPTVHATTCPPCPPIEPGRTSPPSSAYVPPWFWPYSQYQYAPYQPPPSPLAQGSGTVWVSQQTMREHPELAGQVKVGDLADLLADYYFRREDHESCRCVHDGPSFWRAPRNPHAIFRSNLMSVDLAPIEPGTFGLTYLDTHPFKIEISNAAGDGRARIALAHEMSHVMNELLKLGASHDKIHHMGQFLATEALPAMAALEDVLNVR